MNDIGDYLPVNTVKEFKALVGKNTFNLMTKGDGYNTYKLLNFNAMSSPVKYYRCKNIILEYLYKKGKIKIDSFNLVDYYMETYKKMFINKKCNLPIPYLFHGNKLTWKFTFLVFEHLLGDQCLVPNDDRLAVINSNLSPNFVKSVVVDLLINKNLLKYSDMDGYEQSIIDIIINKVDYNYMNQQIKQAIVKLQEKMNTQSFAF